MLDLWSLVRFLHVVGAVVWLGGQLTVSALVMPVARDRLPEQARAGLMRVLGMRFGIATVAVLIPLQIATGVALARHKGVTLASLAEPGYGPHARREAGCVHAGHAGRRATWVGDLVGAPDPGSILGGVITGRVLRCGAARYRAAGHLTSALTTRLVLAIATFWN